MTIASPAELPRHIKEICPLLRSKEPSLSEIMQPEEAADLSLGNINKSFIFLSIWDVFSIICLLCDQ
jgi:hypothetical protein